ncbi:hypothetical protein [Streptomyces tendae]
MSPGAPDRPRTQHVVGAGPGTPPPPAPASHPPAPTPAHALSAPGARPTRRGARPEPTTAHDRATAGPAVGKPVEGKVKISG